MADPTDDDASADDGADVEAADAAADEATDDATADESTGVTTTKRTPTRRRPDPRADVAARRAATKARMDAEAAGEKPDLVKKPVGTASADDPTGTKARRARAGAAGTATADDPTGTKARREAAASAKKVARPSKRTGGAVDAKAVARSGNPKKAATAAESTRYTAPIPRAQLESPSWVPAIMFALLGLGGVVILLTYVIWNGRPLTLGVGLALILGGILTATQYR
ncbi:MAG TPA: hypothetical protein VK507_02870 [Iamia sp.]|nr:hypothetical protein [Iamia sp.]